ncbi:MAG: rhodanese-like domain-containing protein [Succinivibrionaceae bacterium]
MKKLNYLFFIIICFISSNVYAETYWLDVRTNQEFVEKNIPSSINIPHNQIQEEIKNTSIKTDDTIYVFCRSGKRAEIAKEILTQMGYKNVINLGGINEALTVFNNKKITTNYE